MTKIHIVNLSDRHVHGYFPINIDFDPPFQCGGTGRGEYYVGNPSGLRDRNLDIYTGLDAGESMTLDLSQSTEANFQLLPLSSDDWLGGVPVRIGDARMKRVGAEANGVGWDLHYFVRIGPLLAVHVWLHYWPDSPSWCPGRILICASSAGTTDVTQGIPGGFRLQIGEGVVYVPGLPPNGDLMASSDWLASGQYRALSFTVAFWDFATDMDIHTAEAFAYGQVGVRGIQRINATGNPRLPAGFNARDWAAKTLPVVIASQHSWTVQSPLDPSTVSGATGAQGSQSFCAGPAVGDPAAVAPIVIAGLSGKWPMMHLEHDGASLDFRAHHGLRMFYGQPNWAITADKLGKERGPTLAEAHGFGGPEDEHDFDFAAWAAARLDGTPCAQHILEAHAINWLFRWVVEEPGNWLSANRAIGWMAMKAAELYIGLRNRELADAIAERFKDVCWNLIEPQMFAPPGDQWWSWRNDPRIGPGVRAIPWQAEVMCCGLDIAGEIIPGAGARSLALIMAPKIIERAWTQVGGRWTTRDVITLDGSDPGPYLGSYDWFGPKAVDVLVRQGMAHEPAREIRAQREREATTYEQCSWFIPA